MATTFPLERVRHYVLPAVAALIGLGVAVGIATVPSDVLNAAVDRAGLSSVLPAAASPIGTTGRTILALVAGMLIAACGFAPQAKAWLVERLDTFARKPAADARARDEQEEPPVVRRADAHPDAPPRRPIRAASDLGDPLPIFGEEDKRSAPLPPPAEQPLPADLDRPLADFDPAAVPLRAMAPPEPVAPLVRRVGSVEQPDVPAEGSAEWVEVPSALLAAACEPTRRGEDNDRTRSVGEAPLPAPTFDTLSEGFAPCTGTNTWAEHLEANGTDTNETAPAPARRSMAASASRDAAVTQSVTSRLIMTDTAPPADAPDDSIAGLLARLERGAAQRRVVATPVAASASTPAQSPPLPVSEPAPVSLDDTLQRLRRLAAG